MQYPCIHNPLTAPVFSAGSLGGTATLSRSSRRFSRGASANGSLRNPLATGADLGTATLARQAAAVRGSQRSLQSNGSSTFRPGGSVTGWPDGSIPKRVKKLSWEDEQNRVRGVCVGVGHGYGEGW